MTTFIPKSIGSIQIILQLPENSRFISLEPENLAVPTAGGAIAVTNGCNYGIPTRKSCNLILTTVIKYSHLSIWYVYQKLMGFNQQIIREHHQISRGLQLELHPKWVISSHISLAEWLRSRRSHYRQLHVWGAGDSFNRPDQGSTFFGRRRRPTPSSTSKCIPIHNMCIYIYIYVYIYTKCM